ncbi:MAG: hypothetical protein KME64_18880 [Scytonematopsis contorta HA4267-MV1]|jgi:hypothetical protein|nr:hypothetical protein [Scytonematopsis contorta HA4267-MV1]
MSQEANSLTTGNNELVSVDYSNLLTKILQALRNKQSKDLFKISPCGTRLLIDIDSIASQVSQLQIDNPLGASVNNVKAATVNFNPGFKENFPDKIKEIRDCLSRQLQESINQYTNSLSSLSIEEFVNNLITDLQTFKGSSSKLDFTYPFAPYKGLEKQRLTFSDKNLKAREVLRFHKLTITVQKTNELNEQLQAGLAKYIEVKFGDEEEIEELEYVLEDLYKERNNRESDFYKLKRIVDTETLGKLKKQAQINYLEFLHENIKSDNNSNNVTAAIYLEDTIRRLKLVEEYINDVSKADGHYKVYYQGAELNYRDIFSRAEAFDMLPIIPKIEGYLGETKDETSGQIEFIFGVKLKFDGKAQAHGGKSSFQYYLNLLNPESKEHQAELNSLNKDVFARKILRVVFLYYFMFASRSKFSGENYNPEVELSYDPIMSFEQKVLPVFKGGSEEEKRALLIKICNFFEEFEVQKKINVLKKTLINLIKSPRNFTNREYPIHISIKESILESNINTIINERNTFFQAVVRGNPKEVLKYINIGEANSNKNSLCTLPAKITIGDIHYATCDDKQSFSMEYDIANAKVNTLPILFIPFRNAQCQSIYQETLKQRKVVLFNYRLEEPKLDSQQAFIYKFTFSLLAYICLRVLLQKQKWLFLPILRFHVNNKEDDAAIEKFIVSLSGVLSHLLNEKHRSNAQGIDIRDFKGKGKFKIPNVLSSLYSVLPKKFSFNNPLDCPKTVDKLAIIIVSSRESDRTWRGTQKISNLMGEILSFSCKDGAVRIQLMKTFSENYTNLEMFQRPTVVVDEVAKLYHKMGFRHFVYIAKAPYTSTLNMTQTEDDDGLFFMSREVIKAFRAEHDNIKIYPMFFDKYFAVKIGDRDKIRSSSLYIQDTAELSNLVDDPSQQSVVFFNLFNGITVGKAEERNYNGVISYATLLNIYKGILDDEDIRKGLIYSGDLKNEILQYLTLFHFSRYEKAKEVSIKLDPYQNLIGDESVGALSLFNHMRGKGEFNSLAFLTEVKKVLIGE